tara:strand:- start:637 stop:1284 length:648 start_codon:yes stop_codon:yes gene_type:complete
MKEFLKKDFILICDDALNKEECDSLIDLYEDCSKIGTVKSRVEAENTDSTLKADGAIDVFGNVVCPGDSRTLHFTETKFGNLIMDKIYEACREFYTPKWPTLPVSSMAGFPWKIQKTSKGEGYHVWHAEASLEQCTRTLVWTFYLSDAEEDKGGETQFLHYPHTCVPKVGRLMIFPAYFTHAHRGNIYWGHNPKYIATGWLHYHPNSPQIKEDKE